MTRRTVVMIGTVLFAFGLSTFMSSAQDRKEKKKEPSLGDRMIEAYLAAETERLSKKVLDGAKTIEEWKQRRPRLYREYMDMLGLWPIPEKTPLKVTFTGKLERGDVIIEKLHFQSKPGLYVTANLYRPKASRERQRPEASRERQRPEASRERQRPEKRPTILYLCGHSNRGRDGNKSAYQDHGMWFASNGYNCLVLDTLQLGEVPGVHHGTYGVPYNHLGAYGFKDKNKPETRWWWHARGYTPAGVECWNGIRAIDYLLTRDDVDPERIGVTGISGGGAATFWVAAADDRVKLAVPVSGMSDLECYVKDKVINGHCDCMFLYNTYQWEWTTIAALVAPRPMLFANSDNDRIFPMDGNRRISQRLRTLYTMYGKPENFADYVSEGGHAYRPDLRIAIFKFINKHLNPNAPPVKDTDFEKIPGKELRVFPTDADVPKDAINAKIDETFVPLAKVKLPEKGKYDEWKKGLMKELSAKVFRAIPDSIVNSKEVHSVVARGKGGSKRVVVFFMDSETYGNRQDVERAIGTFTDEDDSWEVWFPRFYFLPRNTDPPASYSHEEIHSWTRKSPPNYVERSHVLLGRTIDELKVYHLLGSVRSYQDQKRGGSPPSKIVGFRQAGILAAYAALFEPSITEVVIIDPPASHRDGPYFLNVLRVLDIPEALGMLAPRKLTLINAKDHAFDRTEEIYRIAGAADKLTRK